MRQLQHPLLVESTHDESARQDFAKSMRLAVTSDIQFGNRHVYEKEVAPAFEKAQKRPLKNRTEARHALLRAPYFQMWSSLKRTTQELVWASVIEPLDRQADAIKAKAKKGGKKLGSLRMNPAIDIPRYISAVDIHSMPGNYHTEHEDEDIYQGALFDRGAWIYAMGSRGPLHDNGGFVLFDYLKKAHPGFTPKRILDMGATIGGSTLPWCDVFPDAEVHAIDVAGPCVRYGHARAEALGKKVHFHQMNAEKTDFADESFDLVVSCIMMHETATTALHNIFAETHRVLRKGGVALHMDGPQYENLPVIQQVISDWDTQYNAEPFIGTLHDMNLTEVMRKGGFSPARVKEVPHPRFAPNHTGLDINNVAPTHRAGNYLIVDGVK